MDMDMESEEDYSPPFNKFLYFTAFSVNIAAFSMGAATVWSSPAITRLNGLVDTENNPLQTPLIPLEEAGLASLLLVGATFSALASRSTIDKIGRKPTLLLSAIPNFFGFICLTTATTKLAFYIGRFLTGVSVGIVFAVAPTYIREVSDGKHLRFLSISLVFSINLGSLFVYLIAPFCTLKTISMLNVFPSIAYAFFFGIWASETPYYYVKKCQMYNAWTALKKLRYHNETLVDLEMVVMQKKVVDSFADLTSIRDFFHGESHRRTLIIVAILVALYQFTGINVILFYMEGILYETQAPFSIGICTIILGGIQLVGSVFASVLLAKLKRRVVLGTSVLIMAITQFSLGLYLCLKTYLNIEYGKAIPLIAISFFVWESTVAFGPFAISTAKDLFPPYANSLGTTILTVSFMISSLVIIAIFPAFSQQPWIGFTFGTFGVFCALACLLIHFYLPEKRERSIEENEPNDSNVIRSSSML